MKRSTGLQFYKSRNSTASVRGIAESHLLLKKSPDLGDPLYSFYLDPLIPSAPSSTHKGKEELDRSTFHFGFLSFLN